MQQPIVIMNFSHIYEDEKFYRPEQKSSTPAASSLQPSATTGRPSYSSNSLPSFETSTRASAAPHILDFTSLTGTNGFCDDTAVAEIRRRIAEFPASGIHFLDNGNYHYLTRFWCEKITEDFVLVVYDHHVDLRKPVFPGLMSCGSWIRDVLLRNTHCRGILIIGPNRVQAGIINAELMTLSSEIVLPEERMPAASVADRHARVKECVRTCEDLQDPLLNVSLYSFTEDDILSGRVDSHIPPLLERIGLPIYISIDKDVLSRKVLHTNWDQGIMTEAELMQHIRFFMMSPEIRILGMDVCGEPAYNAYRRILDDARNIRRSDGVNQRLLELYMDHPDLR